jgi:ABC-2 type transport system ATP-binding protein
VLSATGIHKRYGSRRALDGVDLTVRPGQIVGLLGPNGAGKTTLLSILAMVLAPDAGRVVMDDDAPLRSSERPMIGLVPQSLALYPRLTVLQNVWHFARMLGLSRREAHAACALALGDVGLLERAHDATDTLSGGMQRRLNLACGLVHRPRVLLLDEPTVGVDLESRERLLAAVRRARTAGTAVVYSTHYMEEAERICDRVVLIDEGRVVTSGAPAALVRSIGDGLAIEVVTARPLPPAWLEGLAGARAHAGEQRDGVPNRGSVVRVSIDRLELAPRVLERAAEHGAKVMEFHVEQPSLQDVFLSLTGRGLRD